MLEWTLLNSTVALVGYYFAAFTIDRPWMGRTRMQSMGFAWMGEAAPREQLPAGAWLRLAACGLPAHPVGAYSGGHPC